MYYLAKTGEKYLGQKNTLVDNINDAIHFSNKHQYNSATINSLPAEMKKMSWEPILVMEKIQKSENKTYNGYIQKIYNEIKKHIELKNKIGRLNKELSVRDQMICDIYHYIEFNQVKKKDCADLIFQLKQILEERRTIKEEISCINIYFGTMSNEVIDKYVTIYNNLVNSSEKIYTPRQLSDLFEKL